MRTPVLWPSECGRVVDRSVDEVAHFDYGIPYEDTELTPDELPDSRTHQFFALCRQHPLTELLPPWISTDDVDRSLLAGLIESAEVGDEAILDISPTWAGCFGSITEDDARRPITLAQAEAGIDWDVSAVAVGVWSLAGYTFEPPLNLWRDRPGFVKVLDDPTDPEQDLPALALLGEEQVVEPGHVLRMDACVDVLEPAHIELEWAAFLPTLEWQPLAAITVDGDGPLVLEPPAPIAAADSEVLVRGRLVDALGREYVAYLPVRVSVTACGEQGCTEPTPPAAEPRGCSTSPRAPTAPVWALLVSLGLALTRRTARGCACARSREPTRTPAATP